MKSREEIITAMCYTWRHDYGLTKVIPPECGFLDLLSAGMTKEEQQALWNQMAQIFDNDIAPNMEFRHKVDAQLAQASWATNPDRSGGAFTQDEIDRSGGHWMG